MMDSESVLLLIESLGDDAKLAFIIYLALDYASLWVLFGLVTWGVRTLWKNRKDMNL